MVMVWVDIETTGLTTDDEILEVGFVVTNNDMTKRLGELSFLIQHYSTEHGATVGGDKIELRVPAYALRVLDPVVEKMHRKSGLLEALAQPGPISYSDGEALASMWLGMVGPSGTHPMCGSSVHFDRMMLRTHMPQVEEWFHYRNIDISTFKEACGLWKPEVVNARPVPQALHRALPDIEDTIQEARHYKEALFR